jgi:hypothetical protein
MTHLFHQKFQHHMKNSPETTPDKKLKTEKMFVDDPEPEGFIWMVSTNKNVLKAFDEKICNQINKSHKDIVEFFYHGRQVSLDKVEMTLEDDQSKIPVYKYAVVKTKSSSPERKFEQNSLTQKPKQRRDEESSYNSPKSSKSSGSFYDDDEEDFRPQKSKNSKKSPFQEEEEEIEGKWSWKSDKGFVSYDDGTSKELELSYSKNKRGICKFSGYKGKEYVVDFKNMLQYPSDDASKKRPVKRE